MGIFAYSQNVTKLTSKDSSLMKYSKKLTKRKLILESLSLFLLDKIEILIFGSNKTSNGSLKVWHKMDKIAPSGIATQN
jgi:hypothetical protein